MNFEMRRFFPSTWIKFGWNLRFWFWIVLGTQMNSLSSQWLSQMVVRPNFWWTSKKPMPFQIQSSLQTHSVLYHLKWIHLIIRWTEYTGWLSTRCLIWIDSAFDVDHDVLCHSSCSKPHIFFRFFRDFWRIVWFFPAEHTYARSRDFFGVNMMLVTHSGLQALFRSCSLL